jgi:hypothetical protein
MASEVMIVVVFLCFSMSLNVLVFILGALENRAEKRKEKMPKLEQVDAVEIKEEDFGKASTAEVIEKIDYYNQRQWFVDYCPVCKAKFNLSFEKDEVIPGTITCPYCKHEYPRPEYEENDWIG